MSSDKRGLARIVAELHSLYGPPDPPAVTDPLQMILWENVGYLADDAPREAAYRQLVESVGATPEQILTAPASRLFAATLRGGILPELRARTLLTIAEIALTEFGGDLRPVLRLPLPNAKRALQRFPGIDEPYAEKILLFSRSHPVLALDSNGLRVLLRLGFGQEQKSYAATYRAVQEALSGEVRRDFDWLIEAHQLLRRHGQETCRRSHPLCERCPLTWCCKYYLKRQREALPSGAGRRARAR
jgi:endonuclease III